MAFFTVFASLLGNYKKFCYDGDFDYEEYLSAQPDTNKVRFVLYKIYSTIVKEILEQFLGTQAFHQFKREGGNALYDDFIQVKMSGRDSQIQTKFLLNAFSSPKTTFDIPKPLDLPSFGRKWFSLHNT